METLGQKLVGHGWITEDQLRIALRRQHEMGGRLGTCLLEIGALPEDLLLRVLSEQLKVPAASIEDLRNIPRDVYSLLPRKLAIQHQAVPFRLGVNRVDLAMLDVHNIALHDELSFAVGRQLNVHIANEARLFEALEKFYGKACPARFTHILERLNRTRDGWRQPQVSAAGGARPAVAPAPQPRPRPRPVPVEPPAPESAPPPRPRPAPTPRSIPLTAEEQAALRSSPEPKAKRSTSVEDLERLRAAKAEAGLSLDDVEALLERARDPQEIGRILFDYLSQEFLRVLLFQVTHGEVRGWMGRGPDLDKKAFEGFRLGFDQPSIFLNLRQGGSFFMGKLPAMEAHNRLAECWGGDLDNQCAVFPIRVRDHLVSLLYGDRDCLGLKDLDLGMLQRLARKAAIAFEMCIMQQKMRSV